MGRKVQFAVQVDEDVRNRLDALRIVIQTSRARVGEMAWQVGGLKDLEKRHREGLDRLEALASRANMTLTQYVQDYARKHQRKTYGPSLAELEDAAGIAR